MNYSLVFALIEFVTIDVWLTNGNHFIVLEVSERHGGTVSCQTDIKRNFYFDSLPDLSNLSSMKVIDLIFIGYKLSKKYSRG